MAEDTASESKTPAKTRTSPAAFLRQVQAETKKVVWPSREETVRTAIFVFILMLILSLFFLGVDTLFGWVVRQLMGLL
ncbi:MAG: preprotein translocase subunit SecE [Erythrobacter sp.]|nr:preprotein translocase subunit SecE [Erythrobacter sp.]